MIYEEARRIVVREELKKLSDEDLLLELRERKRFARIAYNTVIPRHEHMENAPDDYTFPRMMGEFGRDLGRRMFAGEFSLPGFKREREHRYPGCYDEKFTIPLNFVVDKK